MGDMADGVLIVAVAAACSVFFFLRRYLKSRDEKNSLVEISSCDEKTNDDSSPLCAPKPRANIAFVGAFAAALPVLFIMLGAFSFAQDMPFESARVVAVLGLLVFALMAGAILMSVFCRTEE